MRYRFDVKTPDLIVWKGHIVMSRSEKPFFEKLFRRVSRLRPKKVLEIWYGLGIFAQLIQGYLQPLEHHIVEIDTQIYKDLESYAAKMKSVLAIRGSFWTFKTTTQYDFIFNDPFEYGATDGATKEQERAYYTAKADRMRELCAPSAIVCQPQFWWHKPETMRAFRLKLHERLKVPPYLSAEGIYTDRAAIVCWQAETVRRPSSSVQLTLTKKLRSALAE